MQESRGLRFLQQKEGSNELASTIITEFGLSSWAAYVQQCYDSPCYGCYHYLQLYRECDGCGLAPVLTRCAIPFIYDLLDDVWHDDGQHC